MPSQVYYIVITDINQHIHSSWDEVVENHMSREDDGTMAWDGDVLRIAETDFKTIKQLNLTDLANEENAELREVETFLRDMRGPR